MLSTSLNVVFNDAHEYIISTISLLTGYSDTISMNMWGLFPALVGLFDHYLNSNGQYYILEPIVLSMCNYTQKGKDIFVNQKMENDQTPLDCLFIMISDVFQHSAKSYSSMCVYGFNLLICLLENLVEQIDQYLEPIIVVLAGQVNQAKSA